MDTVREVAEEGKRLIDRTWLGELERDDAVHRFVQVGDGMVCPDTAGEIIDDGVRWLDANATRLRILGWCALLEVPILGGFAVLSLAFGDYLAALLALTLLGVMQFAHRKLVPHPVPVRRPRRVRH
ncbi:hypothetical protein IU433_21000 [Nocardia puris]|uniref:Uncharacterized protein n=1 Tax=Nocardia puris TaxID=208602 RepID=A0A366D993_9NOCA|nr:hypothetical protein [Nocardia puris]MBF6214112.1 hypothetical protein [Nocardia puris]MBF6368604.1 hypothetical protein [Nocardia puris]MBF6461506.1 hypothetical protein [Nocardia puris]RBO86622.1 hypothetical protein DFR74_113165 [Nocardia puris]